MVTNTKQLVNTEFNNALAGQNTDNTSMGFQGFTVPSVPSPDGVGLPYSKVTAQRDPVNKTKRNLIHWFIPDMGVVKMYVNPNSIIYTDEKDIAQQRTKGGYSVQYWGEKLTTLSIKGNTGSSGIEGINMLYEIYRSEQYAFDPIALSSAAANNAQSAARDLIGLAGGSIGGLIGGTLGDSGKEIGRNIGSNILTTALGADTTALARNIPSLADHAFTIEMYYSGWVYRGFFTRFSVTESTDNLLLSYDISFTATQRRGYRTNYLPWHKNPVGGGGNDSNTYNPYSFSDRYSR